ncbi:chitin synthesis regulation, resistance to congo red domain-containing protein [Trichoderma austrokoningii]
MAPTVDIFARDDGCGYGYFFDGIRCRRKSGWYFWGRWVFAGIAIILALILLFICLCITRRNRRRGVQPTHGTGWFNGASQGQPAGNNNNNNNKYNNAHEMNNYQQSGYNQGGFQQPDGYGGYTSPPPYGQPPVGNQTTGTTFNANDGYNTGHQYGVQQPQSSYYPGGEFQPPAGPPPGK